MTKLPQLASVAPEFAVGDWPFVVYRMVELLVDEPIVADFPPKMSVKLIEGFTAVGVGGVTLFVVL